MYIETKDRGAADAELAVARLRPVLVVRLQAAHQTLPPPQRDRRHRVLRVPRVVLPLLQLLDHPPRVQGVGFRVEGLGARF